MTEVCKSVISTSKLYNNQLLSSQLPYIKYLDPDPCYFNYVSTPNVEIIEEYKYSVKKFKDNAVVKTEEGTFIFPLHIWEFIEDVINRKDPFVVLLYGAPGTGKTSLANFISKVKGLPVISVSVDKVLSKYVGQTEKRFRKFLKKALEQQPSILFFDDGERFFMSRQLALNSTSNALNDIMSNVVTQLLRFMNDVIAGKIKVSVILTTNVSPQILDQAVLSRISLKLNFTLPDIEGVLLYLQEKNVKVVQLRDNNGNIIKMSAEEFARYCVNIGCGFREISLALETKFMPRPESIAGHRVVPALPNNPDDLKMIFDVMEQFDIKCPSRDNIIKFFINTNYIKITHALISTYFVEECGAVVFTPSVNSTAQDYLYAINQYRNPVTFINLPVYSRQYYEIIDELLFDPEKHIVVFTPVINESTRSIGDAMRNISPAFVVSYLNKLKSIQPITHENVIRRVKAFLRVIFNYYGIKIDVNNLNFRGSSDAIKGVVFENLISFRDEERFQRASVFSSDRQNLEEWVALLEQYLKSPIMKKID